VHAQMDVDWPRFQKMFVQLMSSPTHNAQNPQMPRKASGDGKQ
jgi:purine nucleosidase